MEIPESKIHLGHRERMREKFIRHGRDVFSTYELLEMLLYYSIPYRDTNPVSKNLLARFSSLDGVLRAESDRLTEVSGVGAKTAEYIRAVSRLTPGAVLEASQSSRAVFDDYSSVGAYFVEYFKDKREPVCIIAHLKSNMELIRVEKICDGDFSSDVSFSDFIDSVIVSHASAVVMAHNHPYSTHFPTEEDFNKNKLLVSAFSSIGVRVAEHYIVSADRFVGFMHSLPTVYRRITESEPPRARSEQNGDLISNILSPLGERGEASAKLLAERFSGALELSEADFDTVLEALNGDLQTSIYIKLIFAIASRRYTDSFKLGVYHTEEEVREYLTSLFFGLSRETVYMLSLDGEGRIISSDKISEGMVNASGVLPRGILERAKRCGARRIILAHNHPGGAAVPSDEDREAMSDISELLAIADIELYRGYVVGAGKITEFQS